MFGFLRKWMGRGKEGRSRSDTGQSAAGNPHSQNDMNFEKKFDASNEDLSRVRELNESNLYSDGSSEFSRIQARRQDGGDTESLSYPQTRNLRGKGAQPPAPKRRKHRKKAS